MQIDGMREFFSKIAPLNGATDVQSNAFLSALPALAQQKQPTYDSLFLSDIGKKLSLNVRECSSLMEKQKVGPTDSLPPEAQLADKAMAKAIDILERMQKLAIAAQDKKLSDLDRVEMQIEIEDLRANLMVMPINLRGASPVVLPKPVDWGDYGYGDYSSVLGRTRERILSGQEWDVREAWSPEGFTRVTYDDKGEEVWEIGEANAWYVVDDVNVLTYHEGKNVDNGEKVPTVRQMLEWGAPVIVMDAKSAAKGARHLEQQIASIQKWREQLPANLENLSMENAIAFLETIAFPGGHHNAPLTDPSMTTQFLFSDGVYDHRYVTRNLEESDGGDIPLTDGEIIKNYMVAAGWVNKRDNIKIIGYSGPKLREEYVATVPQNENAKIIYIKGVGALTRADA